MAIRKKREEQLQRMEADMKINRKEKRSREDKRLEKKEKERSSILQCNETIVQLTE